MTKLTISLPEDLADAIRVRAEDEGTTVSGLIANDLRRALLLAEGRAALRAYEAEHGAITAAEKEKVRRWAGRSTQAP